MTSSHEDKREGTKIVVVRQKEKIEIEASKDMVTRVWIDGEIGVEVVPQVVPRGCRKTIENCIHYSDGAKKIAAMDATDEKNVREATGFFGYRSRTFGGGPGYIGECGPYKAWKNMPAPLKNNLIKITRKMRNNISRFKQGAHLLKCAEQIQKDIRKRRMEKCGNDLKFPFGLPYYAMALLKYVKVNSKSHRDESDVGMSIIGTITNEDYEKSLVLSRGNYVCTIKIPSMSVAFINSRHVEHKATFHENAVKHDALSIVMYNKENLESEKYKWGPGNENV